MPRKKKPFIDPEHGVTYSLVHRSQRDPAIADPDATPHVLVPVDTAGGGTGPYGANTSIGMNMNKRFDEKKKEQEQEKKEGADHVRLDDYEYGDLGLPDDGYDYSQHLKPIGNLGAVFIPVPTRTKDKSKGKEKEKDKGKDLVRLPSEVLPSQTENEVGMLNLAAPRGLDLSLDPELVATLDDDVDDDDLFGSDADVIEETVVLDDEHEVKVHGNLDDNFLAQLNQESKAADSEGEGDSDSDAESDVSSNFNADNAKHVAFEGLDDEHEHDLHDHHHQDEDEGQSRSAKAKLKKIKNLTSRGPLSVASSLLSRGGVPTVVEEHFDVMVDSYDDEQIGDLDGDELAQGHLPDEAIEGMLDEFLEERKQSREHGYVPPTADQKPVVREEDEMIGKGGDGDGNAEVERVVTLNDLTRDGKSERWDVETVLSTLTNTDNIPGMIGGRRKEAATAKKIHIHISTKTGIPHTLADSGREEQEKGMEKGKGKPPVSPQIKAKVTARSKDETAEEKKQRKLAVKAERRARRVQKKTTKTMFSQELHRQREVDKATSTVSMVKF